MKSSKSNGLYLYAIIPTSANIIFDIPGAGEDDDEIYTISNDGLAVVVSSSPLPDYHGLKRNEAAVYLVAHQRVLEAIMQDFSLLPVKFGTVLRDENQVYRFLKQGASLFRSALNRFAGKMQMEVVVLWNPVQVFQEIGQEETIVQLKTQVVNRSSDDTLGERVALGRLVQAALEGRRTALREKLLPALREVALDMVINPLMDDNMVANVALLIDNASGRALDQRIETLDAEFVSGKLQTPGNTPLTFRCVGPLPPYSFATVEAQQITFDEIETARRVLNLKERASYAEIKKAYRSRAAQMHPDHITSDNQVEAIPDACLGMDELTKAYRFLTAYVECQVIADDHLLPSRQEIKQSDLSVPEIPCSFTREAVKDALLIAIRQPDISV
jgi:hypothetical protein